MSPVACPECGRAGGIEVECAATRGQGEVTTKVTVSYPAAAAMDFEAAKNERRRHFWEFIAHRDGPNR